jgi:CelD/BcsL family acetyltransferase involved in cellulose biosynthesis
MARAPRAAVPWAFHGVIDTISTLSELDRVRACWDDVYARDQHANVFMTWPWVRAHLSTLPSAYQWLVLAYRPDTGPYTAFLPLVRKAYAPCGITLGHELFLGGYPRADHMSIIAIREEVASAVVAFTCHIEEKLAWENFQLLNVLDPDSAELVGAFARIGLLVHGRAEGTSTYLRLPGSWEDYLAGLSANARQQLRTKARKIERLAQYRLLYAGAENVEEQIETLLALHCRRWGRDLPRARRRFGDLFRQCFATGCLYLVSAWDGTTPLAALAAFLDHRKRGFSFYITGYNDDCPDLSPGRFIIAHSIRDAIERGFELYDFLHGDEPYKAHFGVETRETHNTIVTRPGKRARVLNLVRACVRATRATQGALADAIRG